MKRIVAGVVVIFLAMPILIAQEKENPLTLDSVLQKALGTNELVEQAREDLKYSQLLRRAAWNAFFPQATLNGGLIRNDSEIIFGLPGENDEIIEITMQNEWDYSATLHIGSPLYLGGRLYKTVAQSGINIGISENMLTKAQLDLIFQVSAAYTQVVKEQRNVKIQKSSLDLANRQLRHAKVLFDAGEGIRTSVLRAEAQVAQAEMELIQTENQLDKARQDLNLLVELGGKYALSESTAPVLPADSLEQLISIGLDTRLDIKALDKQMQITELEIQKAFGEKLPEIEWGFDYVKQRAGFPTDTFWKLSLNASITLWDSGASTVKKAQQESMLRKNVLSRQLLQKQIKNEIVKAYLDYQNVLKARVASEKQLKAVREAYDDIERFYKAGETTDLDVQDLRQQLISAEIANSNLITDEKLALYQLRYSMGLPVIKISEELF